MGGPGRDSVQFKKYECLGPSTFREFLGNKTLKSFLGGAKESKWIFFKDSDVSDFWFFDFRK